MGEWGERRQRISRLATRAARLIMKSDVKDPMSGFFLMRRQAFDKAVRNLSQQGFKVLLDLFVSAPQPLRYAELPYEFRTRVHGESKLDLMVAWEYGILLVDKLFGRFIPPTIRPIWSDRWSRPLRSHGGPCGGFKRGAYIRLRTIHRSYHRDDVQLHA
jgi:dolichol-phosphate mannosyltransferase